jgi:hypothetical protein
LELNNLENTIQLQHSGEWPFFLSEHMLCACAERETEEVKKGKRDRLASKHQNFCTSTGSSQISATYDKVAEMAWFY